MPVTINDIQVALWRTLKIVQGDKISFGYATSGARTYLAVSQGFDIPLSFSSTATVIREGIGGLTAKSCSGAIFCHAHPLQTAITGFT